VEDEDECEQVRVQEYRRAFRRDDCRRATVFDADADANGRDAASGHGAAADRPAYGPPEPAREPADAAEHAAARAAEPAGHAVADDPASACDHRPESRADGW